MRTISMLLGITVASLASIAGAVETAAPAVVEMAAPAVIDPGQQTVCRKDRETGSLVKAKKTCHTRSQWQYIDEENQRFSRNLVDETRTRSSGQ